MSREQDRWQLAKAVLDGVIAIKADERSSFLDRACDGDAELRREVESLLLAHEQAGSAFLKTAAVGLRVPAASSREGLRIGVYQITKEIGHGGMGEVVAGHPSSS